MGKIPQKTGNDIDFSDLSRYHKRRLEGRGAWKVLPPIKQQLTVRIDADVVSGYAAKGGATKAAYREARAPGKPGPGLVLMCLRDCQPRFLGLMGGEGGCTRCIKGLRPGANAAGPIPTIPDGGKAANRG